MPILLNLNQEIISLYSTLSIAKIAKKLNIDRGRASKILKENNIEVKSKGIHLRKYPLNESYFDNIDCEEKAYFLGLLYADGCNHYNDKKKKVTISLQFGDKEILSKFSTALYGVDFLQSIKGRNGGQDQFRLNISSKHISNKLNELGCIPNKSLLLKFPEWLRSDLKQHFIRGYFDGDGSLSSSKRRLINDYQWSLVSTRDFCNEISKIISSELGIHVIKKDTCGNGITTTICVRGNNQILKLSNWIYADSNVYLERKYKKYIELKYSRE